MKMFLRRNLHTLLRLSDDGISVKAKKSGQRCFPVRNVSNFKLENFFSLIPVTLQTRSPDEAITVDIAVYDIKKPNMSYDTPLVLTLHGAPGSSKDFDVLGPKLLEKGIRVISLDLPGFGKSKLVGMDMYKLDHTTEGRYQMLTAILDALSLSRIDVLVSQSAGTWLGYKAAADLELAKTFVFVNPLGAKYTRTVSPLPFFKLLSAAAQTRFLHSSLPNFLSLIYKKLGYRLAEEDFSSLLISLEIVKNTSLDKMEAYGESVANRNVPFVMVISRNDKIADSSLSMEMAHIMGVKEEETTEYDREGRRTVREAVGRYDDKHFRRVLVFERGGHVAQRAHATEITSHICQFLTVIGK